VRLIVRGAYFFHAATADDEDLAAGASKLGGLPDLPDGFDWPQVSDQHLAFFAQINLAALP